VKPLARKTAAILLVALTATSLGACGKRKTDSDKVLRIVKETERLAARYVYTDQRYKSSTAGTDAQLIEVQGIKEDDFRFKARVMLDGSDAFDEVVSDDTLAMRFINANRLIPLVNKDQFGSVDQSTSVPGVGALAALQSRRWVLDQSSAPSITVGDRKTPEIGTDPVLDAMTALQYVESAIKQSAGVKKFSKRSLEPAYSSSEDDFPKPADNSAVVRYDLVRPQLPAAVNRTGRDENSLPTTKHFRRMAIYVKDGHVINVREAIDLRGKKLSEFIKYNRAALAANGVPDAFRKAFEAGVKQRPTDPKREAQFGREILAGLNRNLSGLGIDPVLVRTMSVDYRDIGHPTKVDLPADDVIKASLDFLVVTDKGKAKKTTGGASGSSATTTTAPASTSPADSTSTSAPSP